MCRAILTLILCSISVSALAKTISVNVITLTTLPASTITEPGRLNQNTKADVIVSLVDLPTLLIASANQKLKGATINTLNQYTKDLKQIFSHYQRQLQNAYQGIGLATALNIHQLPAVVFDHQYIVYGTTDVNAAYEALLSFKQQRGALS